MAINSSSKKSTQLNSLELEELSWEFLSQITSAVEKLKKPVQNQIYKLGVTLLKSGCLYNHTITPIYQNKKAIEFNKEKQEESRSKNTI